jgi:hypothetical protein
MQVSSYRSLLLIGAFQEVNMIMSIRAFAALYAFALA